MVKQYVRNICYALAYGFLFIPIYCYSTNNRLSGNNVHSDGENTLEFAKTSFIKSVKVHKQGWELSEPAIELHANDRLLLSFDDISENPGTYSYTLIHCDSEWNPSPLFLDDYMHGFEVNEIKDYSYSTGTIISYMHCRLEIPNNDVKIRISGNYILRVFNTYFPEEILIQRRFVVYESLLDISAKIRQPSVGEFRYSGQQIDLKVNTGGIRITDPYSDIKVIACQNYPFQGCYHSIQPTHVKGNELDYDHPDALIFEGGNEFRIFDTKNLRYLSQGMQGVDYHGGVFHVQLKPEESRRRLRYSYYSDLNGKFVPNLERSSQSNIEADYAWIYFTLNVPFELDEGKSVYLFGELTGWQISPDNKLIYSKERQSYELRLLLKQGAYSYRYLLVDDATGEVDITHFEGTHFDTENTYMVLVYYKPLGARYERCVGYTRVSSQR